MSFSLRLIPKLLVILQRVKSASVSVDGVLVSSIQKGVLALAAVSKDDTLEDCHKSASKLLKMKLWDDIESGKSVRKHLQACDCFE